MQEFLRLSPPSMLFGAGGGIDGGSGAKNSNDPMDVVVFQEILGKSDMLASSHSSHRSAHALKRPHLFCVFSPFFLKIGSCGRAPRDRDFGRRETHEQPTQQRDVSASQHISNSAQPTTRNQKKTTSTTNNNQQQPTTTNKPKKQPKKKKNTATNTNTATSSTTTNMNNQQQEISNTQPQQQTPTPPPAAPQQP